MFASCNQVINMEMPLPPCEEFFYIPTKLVDTSYLLGSHVKPICGNPVFFAANVIAHEA
jgi:hypothetical protein